MRNSLGVFFTNPNNRVKLLELSATLGQLGLIGWTSYVLWRIISEFQLEGGSSSTTVLRLDLLQAAAFVLAWTAFLIAVTVRMVNVWRNLEFVLERVNSRFDSHLEDETTKMRQVESKFDTLEERAEQIVAENQQLREENEGLRKQLEARATKELGE